MKSWYCWWHSLSRLCTTNPLPWHRLESLCHQFKKLFMAVSIEQAGGGGYFLPQLAGGGQFR
jgi:hypothetical protein